MFPSMGQIHSANHHTPTKPEGEVNDPTVDDAATTNLPPKKRRPEAGRPSEGSPARGGQTLQKSKRTQLIQAPSTTNSEPLE